MIWISIRLHYTFYIVISILKLEWSIYICMYIYIYIYIYITSRSSVPIWRRIRTRVLLQYSIRRLIVTFHKFSKPRDFYLELSDLCEIWQAYRQMWDWDYCVACLRNTGLEAVRISLVALFLSNCPYFDPKCHKFIAFRFRTFHNSTDVLTCPKLYQYVKNRMPNRRQTISNRHANSTRTIS